MCRWIVGGWRKGRWSLWGTDERRALPILPIGLSSFVRIGSLDICCSGSQTIVDEWVRIDHMGVVHIAVASQRTNQGLPNVGLLYLSRHIISVSVLRVRFNSIYRKHSEAARSIGSPSD